MSDKIITFQTAKLAKEKGFNVSTSKRYVYRGIEHTEKSYIGVLTDTPLQCDILAPTQSFLQKWLRDVYKIDIEVMKVEEGYKSYAFKNHTQRVKLVCDFINERKGIHEDYEISLEEALIEGLNLVE